MKIKRWVLLAVLLCLGFALLSSMSRPPAPVSAHGGPTPCAPFDFSHYTPVPRLRTYLPEVYQR
jgi:hypothetical protein